MCHRHEQPQRYEEGDVVGHTCWVVVGRKVQGGQLFFLGSRFAVESFCEDDDVLPDYRHRASGRGETFLIPLAGEWFDRLYRKPKLYSHGFRFMPNAELARHFESVVEKERLRQAKQPAPGGALADLCVYTIKHSDDLRAYLISASLPPAVLQQALLWVSGPDPGKRLHVPA